MHSSDDFPPYNRPAPLTDQIEQGEAEAAGASADSTTGATHNGLEPIVDRAIIREAAQAQFNATYPRERANYSQIVRHVGSVGITVSRERIRQIYPGLYDAWTTEGYTDLPLPRTRAWYEKALGDVALHRPRMTARKIAEELGLRLRTVKRLITDIRQLDNDHRSAGYMERSERVAQVAQARRDTKLGDIALSNLLQLPTHLVAASLSQARNANPDDEALVLRERHSKAAVQQLRARVCQLWQPGTKPNVPDIVSNLAKEFGIDETNEDAVKKFTFRIQYEVHLLKKEHADPAQEPRYTAAQAVRDSLQTYPDARFSELVAYAMSQGNFKKGAVEVALAKELRKRQPVDPTQEPRYTAAQAVRDCMQLYPNARFSELVAQTMNLGDFNVGAVTAAVARELRKRQRNS